jgi:hypothetical protein
MSDLCQNDAVPIKQGRNIWVISRTDRDAPHADQIVDSAGAVLKRWLGAPSPLGQRSIFEAVPSPKIGGFWSAWIGSNVTAQFFIGAARPVTVGQSLARPSTEALVPSSEVVGRFEACPNVRMVNAQTPIWVIADFDWRAADTTIPWPRRSVNALGIPTDNDQALDWLLVEAAFAGPADQPDGSLGGDVAQVAKDDAGDALKALSPIVTGALYVAGAGLIGLMLYKLASRRSRALAA